MLVSFLDDKKETFVMDLVLKVSFPPSILQKFRINVCLYKNAQPQKPVPVDYDHTLKTLDPTYV